MTLVEQLHAALPSILSSASDLQKKNGKESAGPCPVCGGDDRFIVFSDKDRFFCRQCEIRGDKIDFHKIVEGVDTLPELAEAMGIKTDQEKKQKPARVCQENLTASYDYQDENKVTLYTVDRYEEPGFNKTFRQWHIRNGERINNTKGVRRVPYLLSLLLDSPEIYIVEGEKDADRLVNEGIPATCFMGAKWLDEYTQYFKGRTVFILPDNDGPGEILGRTIAKATGGKIVNLPGLPDKGDVSDWLDAGNTLENFWQAVQAAETVKTDAEEAFDSFVEGFEVSKSYTERIGFEKFIYPNLVIKNHVLTVIGLTGSGKTAFFFNEVAPRLARDGHKVMYFDFDSPASDHPKMKESADEAGFMFINPDTRRGKSIKDLIDGLQKYADAGVDLTGNVFIFDTLKKVADLMSKKSVKIFFMLVRKMVNLGATVVLLGHANKYPNKDGNLVFEGVGDIRADGDDLIFLARQTNKNGGIDVTTIVDVDRGAKVRGLFKPFSFHISESRAITFYDEPIDLIDSTVTRTPMATTDDILTAAEKYVQTCAEPPTQNHIADHVSTLLEGAGKARVKKTIVQNSKLKDDWQPESRDRLTYEIGKHNKHTYFLPPEQPEQTECFS